MNKFYNYNNPICTQTNSHTVFSFDPSILSLKELLLFEIRQSSYYTNQISELSKKNLSATKRKIIEYISLLALNLNFKRENLKIEIDKIRKFKNNLQKKYIHLCSELNIEPVLLDNIQSRKRKSDIIEMINEGEEASIRKSQNLSAEKKSIYEIMMNLAMNACIYIKELSFVNKNDQKAEDALIKLLSESNFLDADKQDLIDNINYFNKENDKMLQRFRKLVFGEYGNLSEVTVPNLIKKGKAILVSGHYFRDLKIVLDALKDTDINVYTHGEMIIAHSLDEFKKYKNLVGHYQKSSQNFQDDFASFRGVILLSRNPQACVDLIRGKLFTISNFPARGIQGISEKDLTPLIDAVQNSVGFNKDKLFGTINVGFNEQKFDKKIDEIIEKIKNKEIRSLMLIGLINYLEETDDYIKELLNLIPKDSFVINIGQGENKKNIWNINSYSEMLAFYQVIRRLKNNFDISKLNFSVFLTRCDRLTIFHIIHMAEIGIKNIFLGECCPTTVSPSLISGLKDLFGVKTISYNPETDIREMLNFK